MEKHIFGRKLKALYIITETQTVKNDQVLVVVSEGEWFVYLSLAAACDGNFYQLPAEANLKNTPQGVLPI